MLFRSPRNIKVTKSDSLFMAMPSLDSGIFSELQKINCDIFIVFSQYLPVIRNGHLVR